MALQDGTKGRDNSFGSTIVPNIVAAMGTAAALEAACVGPVADGSTTIGVSVVGAGDARKDIAHVPVTIFAVRVGPTFEAFARSDHAFDGYVVGGHLYVSVPQALLPMCLCGVCGTVIVRGLRIDVDIARRGMTIGWAMRAAELTPYLQQLAAGLGVCPGIIWYDGIVQAAAPAADLSWDGEGFIRRDATCDAVSFGLAAGLRDVDLIVEDALPPPAPKCPP